MPAPRSAPRRSRRLALASTLAAWLAVPAVAGARPPNLVVFLTDDQRFDTLWAMPLVQNELASRGVVFEQAFVTTPMCCPSRASFLSGGYYAHDTGVLSNVAPNGGATVFRDANTLAVRLQGAGYATGLIGKYLNGYERLRNYVPPGWSLFHAVVGLSVIPPALYVRGSTTTAPGVGIYTGSIWQYDTDYLRDRALEFVDAHVGQPFFLYLALGAPHAPAPSAPEDASLFATFAYRGRAYREPDVSDKPARIADAAAHYDADADDAFHRAQLRSLQAVDRAVAAIVARISMRGLLDDTVLVFTSDNGLLWGEHHLTGKGQPYEEAIRVPLVVVVPGIAPRVDARLVAMNLDVPATLADLAGLVPEGAGQSLLPLLVNPAQSGRREALLEEDLPARAWTGLRWRDVTGDWKLVESTNGDRELYRLTSDPYEEQNLARDPKQAVRVAYFGNRIAALRRVAITTDVPPGFVPGTPYAFQIGTWGLAPPAVWSIEAGGLPAGLALDPDTGVVSGIPASAEPTAVQIRVVDSSVAAQSGEAGTYAKWLSFLPAACANGADDDHDGAIDGDDPDCSGPDDVAEFEPTWECVDGTDDDGDGAVDLLDPGCRVAPHDLEIRHRCGIGFEIAALALWPPALRRARRGRTTRRCFAPLSSP